MKIRSTERGYSFADKLEAEIPFYNLQGLTMDGNKKFTAGIEAVEFKEDEEIDLNSIFTVDSWSGKYILCKELGIPLYLIVYKHDEDQIRIYEVNVTDGQLSFYTHSRKSENDFCDWFASIKGTIQTKPLYEADPRKSFFDNLIESKGISWGGNIDSYVIGEDEKVECIIETRLSNRSSVQDYDPARYFKGTYRKRGDYNTWEPLFMLASRLEIPLFLITFSRTTNQDIAGFSTLHTMSKESIQYRDSTPNNNVLRGVEAVQKELVRKMGASPPKIL